MHDNFLKYQPERKRQVFNFRIFEKFQDQSAQMAEWYRASVS